LTKNVLICWNASYSETMTLRKADT